MESEAHDGPSRSLLIAAIVVAVGAIVAIMIVAALRQSPTPDQTVAIASVPAPAAEGPECAALSEALPEALGDFRRAPAAEPVPPAAAAWRATADGEAVIMRCGIDRPSEFVVGTPLQVVDAVQWFRVSDGAEDTRSTWYAVDRPVYVALTLPAGSGPAPIQEISQAIANALPAKAVDPAPVR